LFHLISKLYENTSLLITTNPAFADSRVIPSKDIVMHGERSFAEGERFRWLTEFDGSWAPNYEPN
jgi:hypothetical protein